eukprot:CAMPEP_0117886590 /NCGR_PEP_ID=MMETSP0950-20121206/20463_1 /TAXON_ID=44440 /ORGANISM="Chattonella subsalsa, Strain CCMP2191" /LENGTH=99 /DNA_ID=CAMNT_0005743971 /DNA_START=70 /DNA_END=369 /DNA_ORIENTATION=-
MVNKATYEKAAAHAGRENKGRRKRARKPPPTGFRLRCAVTGCGETAKYCFLEDPGRKYCESHKEQGMAMCEQSPVVKKKQKSVAALKIGNTLEIWSFEM